MTNNQTRRRAGVWAGVLLAGMAMAQSSATSSTTRITKSQTVTEPARRSPSSGSMSASAALPGQLPPSSRIEQAVHKAQSTYKSETGGKNADYIPYLAKVPSNLFGIAVVTVDGRVFSSGEANRPFPIESVAKPFVAAELIELKGPKFVEQKIGTNQTGQKFNSIEAIEGSETHRAGNPLVNAGAITTVSQLPASSPQQRWSMVENTLNRFAGSRLPLNEEVYRSETETNTRNQAITRLMEAYEVLGSKPEEALDVYTKECSVDVTAKQLAVMGATLANGGVNPMTHQRVVSEDTAAKTLAQMATSGLYEDSGEWAYRVGLPAKSGVGGGIVAVVPGKMAIVAFSPPLDKAGNSVRAQKAIASIAGDLGLNVFEAQPSMGVGGSGPAPMCKPAEPTGKRRAAGME